MKRVAFVELMARMAASPDIVEGEIKRALTKVGVKIRDEATRKFGTYQPAKGPYAAWAVLAQVTVDEKLKAGSSGDDPLIGHYAKGSRNKIWPNHLRNTIQWEVSGLSVQIGTQDPLGLWHEYGWDEFDVHFPPRPFLRPALWENMTWAKDQLKMAMAEALMSL